MDPNSAASDYCILATTAYDGFGRAWKTTDNAGRATAVGFDSAGRRAYLGENYVNFSLSASETGIGGGGANNDQDRVTKFTYNELGVLKEQIALDANTALNQTTRYVYAFELSDKGCTIHRPELLRGIIFPDSGDTVSTPIGSGSISGTDHVTYTYYCNGARATATDQRAVVHTYTYDDLNRLTADAATSVPGQTYAVDAAVLSVGRTYDANGAPASVTSYSDAGGTSGHEVNQIVYARDAWGNITASTQDPNGAAGGGDPNVAYTWGYGLTGDAAKYARLEKITLPGGRGIYYNYETDTNFQSLGRVANIAANGSPTETQKYVSYKYLGASMIVDANHPAVPGGLRLTYGGPTHYSGLDRFGRVAWQNWRRTNGDAADRYFYGYDRAGNRKWRAERADAGSAGGRDEAYVYDGLDRLTGAKRGILPSKPYQAPCPGDVSMDGFVDATDLAAVGVNWDPGGQYAHDWTHADLNGDGCVDGADSAIINVNWAPLGVTASVIRQWSWTLSPTGNWNTSMIDGNSQTRTHDKANEILTMSGLTFAPLHDQAGNNVRGPRPADPNANNAAHFRYDAWNRLATVHLDNGSQAGTLDANDSLLATYRYDGRTGA